MDHADGGHVDHDLGGPGDVVRRWRGRPGTGRRVEWNVIDIVTVVDGRITDHWAVADNLPLLAALTEEQP
ncbi:ester cyclase [Nocardioides sp. DS6]|uniref:Ester cyclase n=1 Tax=Nocardioides eburneus TaxID=3231482 RepID=A0ABV3T0D4_9ACTN